MECIEIMTNRNNKSYPDRRTPRFSDIYSVFVSIFFPAYASVSFISVSSAMILQNKRYLDFSLEFSALQV